MKESDPSEMGNEQGLPQLINFRELIDYHTGRGNCRTARQIP